MRVRFWERKQKAVEYKGGKCQKCGYNACSDALTFHHLNPKTKEFDWNRLKRRNWNAVLTELDKCILLCCRCHIEEHHKDRIIDKSVLWLKKYNPKGVVYHQPKKCKHCGKQFKIGSRRRDRPNYYCSKECVRLSQLRVKLNSNELIKLVESSSKSAVARKLGVSDHAITKHYQRAKENLSAPTRI